MNKTAIYICLILICVKNVSTLQRQRPQIKLANSENINFKHFKELGKIEISLVCDEIVFKNFDVFFYGWSAQQVNERRYLSSSEISLQMKNTLVDHLKKINKYASQLLQGYDKVEKYGPLYFEIETNEFITKISSIIENKFINKFDNDKEVAKLSNEYGHYVESIISTIAARSLDLQSVESIYNMFLEEKKISKKKNKISPELVNFESKMANLLEEIVKFVLNIENEKKYTAMLEKEEFQILELVYDLFYDNLPKRAQTEVILERLIGKNNPKPKNFNDKFFTLRFFDSLIIEGESDFTPIFKRDRIISYFDQKHSLEKLHDATEEQFFSWRFLEIFQNLSEIDLYDEELNESGHHDPTKEEKIKTTRIYLMLYKIFTIMRQEKAFEKVDKSDKQTILTVILNWIIQTDVFNENEINFESISQNKNSVLKYENKNIYEGLIEADHFRRYFLALVQILCTHLGISMSTHEQKKIIIERVILFGSFDEVLSNQFKSIIIPKEIINEIYANSHMKQLSIINVEIIRIIEESDKISSMGDSIKQSSLISQKSTGGKIVISTIKDKTNDIVNNEELQNRFNKNIGPYLLKLDTIDHEQTRKNFESLFDEIETSEDEERRYILRSLFIKFVYQTHKSSKSKQIEPFIQDIMIRMVNKIRGKISTFDTQGLKNFFMMTFYYKNRGYENLLEVFKKTSDSQVTIEQFFYIIDVVFFVEYAELDLYTREKAKVGLSKSDLKDLEEEYKITEDVLALNFYGKKDSQQEKEKRQVIETALYKNPFLLEVITSFEYFFNFLGFFDFFQIIGDDSLTSYFGINRIFSTFYSFVLTVRRNMKMKPTNPHQHLLDQIEYCLKYTEEKYEWIQKGMFDPICQFSHRKYAEMYFFYLTYLDQSNILYKSVFNDSEGIGFNTHTRLFMVFSVNYPKFNEFLIAHCNEEGNKRSICVSWKIFTALKTFVTSTKSLKSNLEKLLQQIRERNNVNVKFNMINGLEAMRLVAENGKGLNWSKVLSLFNFSQNEEEEKSEISKLMSFEDKDAKKLAHYLNRTYKKLTISSNEVQIAKLVQSILSTLEDKNNKTFIDEYLTYSGQFMPDFLKLFLQFSVKESQFLEIAKILIEKKMTYSIISINDSSKDSFYAEITNYVSDKSDEHGLIYLRKRLRDRYSSVNDQCLSLTSETFDKFVKLQNADFLAKEINESMKVIKNSHLQEQKKSLDQDQTFNQKTVKIITSKAKTTVYIVKLEVKSFFSNDESYESKNYVSNLGNQLSNMSFKSITEDQKSMISKSISKNELDKINKEFNNFNEDIEESSKLAKSTQKSNMISQEENLQIYESTSKKISKVRSQIENVFQTAIDSERSKLQSLEGSIRSDDNVEEEEELLDSKMKQLLVNQISQNGLKNSLNLDSKSISSSIKSYSNLASSIKSFKSSKMLDKLSKKSLSNTKRSTLKKRSSGYSQSERNINLPIMNNLKFETRKVVQSNKQKKTNNGQVNGKKGTVEQTNLSGNKSSKSFVNESYSSLKLNSNGLKKTVV